MKNNKKQLKSVNTKRNKGLEPMSFGNIRVGYNSEIHGEDDLEFTYKLPLGAIKRLIRSYYEEIKSIDEASVYMHSYGSYELRMLPYCYRMINDIKKQLDKHGIDGKKIADEVFNQYFKKDYEKIKRFDKNHHDKDTRENFEYCSDHECCNYTNNFFYKARVFWKLFIKMIANFKGFIPKKGEPGITWGY